MKYFILYLCGFYIYSSFGSQISNIRFFFDHFCIKSNSNNKTSNTRYLAFNLSNFHVVTSFLDQPTSTGYLFVNIVNLFSISYLSKSNCVSVNCPLVVDIVVSIALALVTNTLCQFV